MLTIRDHTDRDAQSKGKLIFIFDVYQIIVVAYVATSNNDVNLLFDYLVVELQ